jgi:hypothetical protein
LVVPASLHPDRAALEIDVLPAQRAQLAEEWLPAFEEARELGWLDREMRDETAAYSLSSRGETALDMNALLQSAQRRHN